MPGYTMRDLLEALQEHDAAGDTAGAQALVGEIDRLRGLNKKAPEWSIVRDLKSRQAWVAGHPEVSAYSPQPDEFSDDPHPNDAAIKAQWEGERALRAQAWKMQNPVRAEIARDAGGVISGAASLAGLPGDLEDLTRNYGPGFLSRPMKDIFNPDAPPAPRMFANSADVAAKVTEPLGLTGRPEQVPATRGEAYREAAARGVGGALPLLATGGATLPGVISNVGGAVTGGLAGEAVRQNFPGHPLLEAGAGLLGGLGFQKTAAALSAAPLEQVARGLGDATTMEAAGRDLQPAVRDWLQNGKAQRLQEAFATTDPHIPHTALVPINSFARTLFDIADNSNWNTEVVDAIKRVAPKRWLNALNNRSIYGLGYDFSWDEVDKIRKQLGDAFGTTSINEKLGQKVKEQLYRAISDDQRAKLARIHPDLAAEWTANNGRAEQVYNDAGQFKRVVKGNRPVPEDPTPGAAAHSIMQEASGPGGDSSFLRLLQRELPDQANQLAAAHLRVGGPRAWEGLTPEAKEAIMPDPFVRQQLDNIVLDAGARTGARHSSGLGGAGLGLGVLAGEHGGHDMAIALGHSLGLAENSLLPGAIGGLGGMALGLAAPSLARAGARWIRDPAAALPGGLGALAGSSPPPAGYPIEIGQKDLGGW